jgi:dTDP-4-amino-4,6-dideoxygalactose transaminase
MIPFNKPPYTGNEEQHVLGAIRSSKISGDGYYGKLCHDWFENKFKCPKALLTPSCTHALEMAAILIDIQPGDEVIMPSYTFVSTANAFVLRGAKIVFVDIRPDTMNIDETKIEAAITEKTKAIVPVHYAGVGCEIDLIMEIASKYGLYVIEDAAQGMMSTYKGHALGTIGHLGTFSFHETKNFTSGGEGGLLLINDSKFIERAEIIREKGTNRKQFFRGQVDKYSWVDIGTSCLLNEISAAFLWGQLEKAEDINQDRLNIWGKYHSAFKKLETNGDFQLPFIPDNCKNNGHIYYLKFCDLKERTEFIEYMKSRGIQTVFHYIPLHSSYAGQKTGIFHGKDIYTTKESEKLVRLPVWYNIGEENLSLIIESVLEFKN